MGQFLRRRLFKADDPAALRIHRAENVPDDAILASGVGSLQADQQRVFPLGIESKLQLVHALLQLSDLSKRRFFSFPFGRKLGVDFA